MKPNTFTLVVALFFLFTMKSMAQSTADSSTAAKQKITVKAGVNYNSHLNYYGRTDSLKSSGIYPGIEIGYAGLYVKSDFIFINNSINSNQYTGSILSAGYNFKSNDEKVSGNIFASKFLYQDRSVLVQSAVKAQTGASISFNNKILNFNAGADAKFSDQTDFGVTAGLDHLERFPLKDNKTVIVIDPCVYAYAGTQNFTNTYYKEKKFLIFPAGQEQVTENSRKFNMLAYEASLPVAVGTGHFIFTLTPSYIIPQNLVKVDGHPELSETGTNLFYVTAGVSVSF